jgi:hypothetical protein
VIKNLIVHSFSTTLAKYLDQPRFTVITFSDLAAQISNEAVKKEIMDSTGEKVILVVVAG